MGPGEIEVPLQYRGTDREVILTQGEALVPKRGLPLGVRPKKRRDADVGGIEVFTVVFRGDVALIDGGDGGVQRLWLRGEAHC